MPAPDDRRETTPRSAVPLELSPDRAERATPADGDADPAAPLKRHGDALLEGTGSRQGIDPDPALDAAPRE